MIVILFCKHVVDFSFTCGVVLRNCIRLLSPCFLLGLFACSLELRAPDLEIKICTNWFGGMNSAKLENFKGGLVQNNLIQCMQESQVRDSFDFAVLF